MEFFRLVGLTLSSGTATPSVLLFLGSAVLLAAGVAVMARSRVRLHHLEDTPLRHIERAHPHFPSPRGIVTIALSAATLLLAGLRTVEGAFPFDDPYQGLNLASLFLIGGAVGVLAELRWKGATAYTSAALIGTALAFLVLTVLFRGTGGPLSTPLTLLLLVPSAVLASWAFASERRAAVLLTFLLAFAFWLLVFLLQ